MFSQLPVLPNVLIKLAKTLACPTVYNLVFVDHLSLGVLFKDSTAASREPLARRFQGALGWHQGGSHSSWNEGYKSMYVFQIHFLICCIEDPTIGQLSLNLNPNLVRFLFIQLASLTTHMPYSGELYVLDKDLQY